MKKYCSYILEILHKSFEILSCSYFNFSISKYGEHFVLFVGMVVKHLISMFIYFRKIYRINF